MPAQSPNDRRPRAVAFLLTLTVLLLACATARIGMAKTAPKPPKAAAPADVSHGYGRLAAITPPGYLQDSGR